MNGGTPSPARNALGTVMESTVSFSVCEALSVGRRWFRSPDITTPSPYGLHDGQSGGAATPAGRAIHPVGSRRLVRATAALARLRGRKLDPPKRTARHGRLPPLPPFFLSAFRRKLAEKKVRVAVFNRFSDECV